MATEYKVLKARLDSIEREIADVRAKVEALERQEAGKPRPFAELRGIWKGVDFTYEEIKEAEYGVKEEDWE